VHEKFCDAGFQNSHQELLYLFGPAVPDTSPPSLTITSPPDGSIHVLPAAIPLLGEMTDDLAPQYYDITITRTATRPSTRARPTSWSSSCKTRPPATTSSRSRVVDDGGNIGKARVSFTILPEGSEDPDTDSDASDSETDTTGAPDDASGCRLVGPPSDLTLLASLLPLAWLARRRRPR
jgi:hypothetical protein